MTPLDLGGSEFLVVDDGRFTRVVLVKILQQFGNPIVHEAEDGRAALALSEQKGGAIACVITDVEMPHLDGLGLLQAIRVGTGTVPRDLRVILLTGHAEMDRLGPALLLDVDAFLTKPTSKTSVQQCLDRVFGPRVAAERFAADPEAYRAVDLTGELIEQQPAVAAAAARDRNERRATVMSVSPGAVLSRDLLFPNGRLLLRALTPLGERLLERLRELISVCGLPDDLWILE